MFRAHKHCAVTLEESTSYKKMEEVCRPRAAANNMCNTHSDSRSYLLFKLDIEIEKKVHGILAAKALEFRDLPVPVPLHQTAISRRP